MNVPMNAIIRPWLEQGYRTFAYEGPAGLKVERLAKAVGKNKSSFYHHFAEMEIFINRLLRYHMDQATIMADKESKSNSLDALIAVLLEHKLDLLFNRQLRIHRENTAFEQCFIETNEVTYQSIIKLWAEILDLKEDTYLAGLVLRLSLENFFLQITDETLNRNWLQNYFSQLKSLIRAFKKSGSMNTLHGSV